MEYNYVFLFDYSTGELMIIHLSEEERQASENYEDFEDYISEVLEEKYKFKLSQCEWMATDTLNIKHYGTEEEN